MSEVVSANNGALLSFIERAANDPDFDVAKFGELLRLQRDVQHDQARRAFNAAMSDVQSAMLPVVRDAVNTHLRTKYAKLETIDAEVRPIYTQHGFSVRYGSAPAPYEGYIRITCTVAHSDGYFEENYLDAPLSTAGSQGNKTATTPVQGVGSAVTYLRRYLLSMVFNVVMADEDDDGEDTRRDDAFEATKRAAFDTLRRDAAKRTQQEPPATNGKRHSIAPPKGAPDADWHVCLDKVAPALAKLRTLALVEEMGNGPTCSDIIANGPQWAQKELSALLAENVRRFKAPENVVIENDPLTGEDDGSAAHEPELPEVQIEGERFLAAG